MLRVAGGNVEVIYLKNLIIPVLSSGLGTGLKYGGRGNPTFQWFYCHFTLPVPLLQFHLNISALHSAGVLG